MKQLCLDLLETCVCVCVCGLVSIYAPVSLFACVCTVCVCLCIIAPSHINYKMHLIHFQEKNITISTLCKFKGGLIMKEAFDQFLLNLPASLCFYGTLTAVKR